MSDRPKLYPADCPTLQNAAGLRMCPYVLCRHNLVADRVDIERLLRRVGDMPLLAKAADDDAAELIARECERPLFSCSLDFVEAMDELHRQRAADEEAEFDEVTEWGGKPKRTIAYQVPTRTIAEQMGSIGQERVRQICKYDGEKKMGVGLELFEVEKVGPLQSIGAETYQWAKCGDEKVLLVTVALGRTEAFRTGGESELAAYVEGGRVVWEEPFGLDEPGEVWGVEWAKKSGKGKKGGV